MKIKGLIVTFAILSTATAGSITAQAQKSAINDLPPQVKQFADKIQTMNKSQTIELIEHTWGKPTGDIGSGLHIPIWQLKQGELAMHPFNGPSYSCNGKTVLLLKDWTKGKDCLPGSYQVMYSKNKSNQLWCGQIDLKTDGTYIYRQSGQKEVSFFAAQKPKGRYKIKFHIDPQMVLSNLEQPSTVATITLTSDDRQVQHYKIDAEPETRQFVWRGKDLKDITINLAWSSPLKIR